MSRVATRVDLALGGGVEAGVAHRYVLDLRSRAQFYLYLLGSHTLDELGQGAIRILVTAPDSVPPSF